MKIVYEQNVLKVYNDIIENAPRWLQLMGYENFNDFALALIKHDAGIVKLPSGYVILDDYVPGVRVTAHPCFTEKTAFRDIEGLRVILHQLLRELTVARLQICVSEVAGHSIRRVLRELGFRKEAMLQNYTINRCDTKHPLISSDVWVIFK